jgi:MGT family glycosyltransferase
MLQSLLKDRFKLSLHSETRDVRVYALVIGKSGSFSLTRAAARVSKQRNEIRRSQTQVVGRGSGKGSATTIRVTALTYFSFPAHGHINPALSVFRELARRGCEVTFYSTEPFQQAIEETGAQFRSYGAEFRMPERGPGPFVHVTTTLETLLRLSCAVLEHCLEPVRRSCPSHIMYDSFAPWGSIIAQLLGLPAMASVPSILMSPEIDRKHGGGRSEDPQLTPEWYADFAARCRSCLFEYGVREAPSPSQLLQSYADCNLVYTSRLFQPFADSFDADCFRFVGPCLAFRPQAPDFPFERLDGQPLILVSLGTVYGERPEFLRRCVEELAGGPWQIVLAAGEHFPIETLGPMPENLIVRTWVPQIEILRRAAAFLTHGGMNSVQEALYFGVPLVLAPQGADQFWISSRVVELGAGVVLHTDGIEAGAIRASIGKVVWEPGYREAAARIGSSLREAGGHRQAAREIQRFMRSRE